MYCCWLAGWDECRSGSRGLGRTSVVVVGWFGIESLWECDPSAGFSSVFSRRRWDGELHRRFGDDVRGMKGLGSARWSLMKKPPSEPSFVETCRVVFVEEGGSRAGAEEEKRRGARD